MDAVNIQKINQNGSQAVHWRSRDFEKGGPVHSLHKK
jgi:hypothetical protein